MQSQIHNGLSPTITIFYLSILYRQSSRCWSWFAFHFFWTLTFRRPQSILWPLGSCHLFCDTECWKLWQNLLLACFSTLESGWATISYGLFRYWLFLWASWLQKSLHWRPCGHNTTNDYRLFWDAWPGIKDKITLALVVIMFSWIMSCDVSILMKCLYFLGWRPRTILRLIDCY